MYGRGLQFRDLKSCTAAIARPRSTGEHNVGAPETPFGPRRLPHHPTLPPQTSLTSRSCHPSTQTIRIRTPSHRAGSSAAINKETQRRTR